MSSLPENLEKIFLEELSEHEKEKQMPYITNAERIGRQEGRRHFAPPPVIPLITDPDFLTVPIQNSSRYRYLRLD